MGTASGAGAVGAGGHPVAGGFRRQGGDKRVGALSLDERRNRRSYSAGEREALEQVAQTVATAIEQDRR